VLTPFHSSDAIWLFTTNEACDQHNCEQLRDLAEPICCLNAVHDSQASASKSSEACRRLSKTLFLSYRSKILLLWNVALQLGLVNGSTGTVIDFMYREGEAAPSLPYAVIIDFPEYSGPPFFSSDGREKWVPLRASKFNFESSDANHYRMQFPISLSWGLTVWKAQGMTVPNGTKLYAVLGDKERSAGLTYVALSRNENMQDLCIGNGLSFDRISSDISNSVALQSRRREDQRLELITERTKTFYHI